MFFTLEDFRKIEEYLKQNSKKDTDFDSLNAADITPKDSVAIVHNLQNRQVNIFELLSSDITGFFTKERELLDNRIKLLEALIETFTIEKVGLSDQFGDSQIAAVSLKTLTLAFHKIWSTLGDITGEVYEGINMVVTPEYYIGEDGADVHIQANTVEANGIFEHIAFYINGTLLTEADNVDYFEYDTQITETSVVKCEAKIMGITYTRDKIITHYNSFWLGAGSVYSDIMDVEHVIPITNGMRGAYDVHVEEGQKIIIIVGESLADGFLRADLNSVEIPFTESIVTVDDKNYKVFVSEPWVAGDYNIDING